MTDISDVSLYKTSMINTSSWQQDNITNNKSSLHTQNCSAWLHADTVTSYNIIFHSLDTLTMYCDRLTLLKWIFHRWDYQTLTQQQTEAYTTPSHPTSSQQTSAQANTMYVLLHSTKSHHITGMCLVTHRHTASDALFTDNRLECCDQHWASGLPDTFQDPPSGNNNTQTIQYDMIWYDMVLKSRVRST